MPDVQVRIAVAVDAEGRWFSSAHSSDGGKLPVMMKNLPMDVAIHWLTATLPVPEAQTVEAEVETQP